MNDPWSRVQDRHRKKTSRRISAGSNIPTAPVITLREHVWLRESGLCVREVLKSVGRDSFRSR